MALCDGEPIGALLPGRFDPQNPRSCPSDSSLMQGEGGLR